MANDKTKEFGVVYTPKPIVDLMVGEIDNVYCVRICDPACGNGEILVNVAEHICKHFQKPSINYDLMYTLENLTGFDIDQDALDECRNRLDAVAIKYGVNVPPKWNLHKLDALEFQNWDSEYMNSFHCVIGNPPYVRIQHLNEERRRKIDKNYWKLISGCSDLYILFFELGFRLLKDEYGHLIYITPSSWLRTNAGKKLRREIENKYKVCSLYDFGDKKLFNGYSTYTSIVNIQKEETCENTARAMKCVNIKKNGEPEFHDGYKIYTQNGKWSLLSDDDKDFMLDIWENGTALGDIAQINVGIQTLADSVFIFKEGSLDRLCGIEDGITRPILKVSVMQKGLDKVHRQIIYPYVNGKLMPLQQLWDEFPYTAQYLTSNKNTLLARDKGKIDPNKWYGYGREVGINMNFERKIYTSPMNEKPNFQIAHRDDVLFYSGYSITPERNVNIYALCEALNSERMARYIRIVSAPLQGGWYSYAKSYIKSFSLPKEVFL